MKHLVIGGCRSGKSRFAEQCIADLVQTYPDYSCHYVATALALDDEMRARIDRHQKDRQGGAIKWHTHEVGSELAATLHALNHPEQLVLVDCLTLWLSGYLCNEANLCDEANVGDDAKHLGADTGHFNQAKEQLLAAITDFSGHLVIVSNEVGSGIVPLGELSRRFTDEAGWLNQAIAARADKVTLVVAGLPLSLKSRP
ncbi:MAG: bifunctional adenosylcobinamide kinase/adenosylcobinamide-phosphate guanylyltransferase [Shewanella sp.]